MPSGSDNFGFLVTDVARLYRAEVDRRISEAGLDLTPAAARTLVHVERNRPLRQMVLAERMGVEAMTMSGHLDQLEKRGLIQRLPDPDDRRAKLIDLTEAAAPVIAIVKQIGAQLRERLSQTVGNDDWQVVNRCLESLRDELTGNPRNLSE